MSHKQDQNVKKPPSGGSSANTGVPNTASGNKGSSSKSTAVQEKKRPFTEVANSSAEEVQLIHQHL